MHLLHVVAEYVLASTIATFRTGNRMGRVKLDGILLIRVRTQGHVKITSCIGLIALGDRLWDEFGACRPCSE